MLDADTLDAIERGLIGREYDLTPTETNDLEEIINESEANQ